jgi:hypothetical protein
MNIFCNNLNLSISPLRPKIDINNISMKPWHAIPNSDINPKLIAYLRLRELRVAKVSIFSAKGLSFGQIHLDGTYISDEVKLSWTYGEDHCMHWYDTDVVHSHTVNHIDRYYVDYQPDEVTLVHAQKVGCPSLIQAGIPHNVVTYSGVRRNITMMLIDNHTNKALKMNDALKIFNDIIA